MTKLGVVAMVLLIGCNAEESSEERICIAANGCGALATANIDSCVDRLGTVDASRALDECADCLEANTCAQIYAGSCAANCSAFSAVLTTNGDGTPNTYDRNKKPSQLTAAEREAYCTWALDQVGGPNKLEQCMIPDHPNWSATSGSLAACMDHLTTLSCNVTMSVFEDCYETLDSPCDLLTTTAPACATMQSCNN